MAGISFRAHTYQVMLVIAAVLFTAACGGGGGSSGGNGIAVSLRLSELGIIGRGGDTGNGGGAQPELTPAFDPLVNRYTYAGNFDVVTVRAVAANANSRVSLLGMEAAGTVTESFMPDNPATIDIDIVVSADGRSNTYTITYEQTPSTNANVTNLRIEGFDLDQVFQPQNTSYTVTVGFVTSAIDLLIFLEDPDASVTINGAPIADTNPRLTLAEGANDFVIVVTAEDGSDQQTYTLTVTRQTASAFAEQAYLKATNPASGERFGHTLAMSGNRLAIGAPFDRSLDPNDPADISGDSVGAVYIFSHNSGTWTFESYVKAPDLTSFAEFGASLAIFGNRLVVGSPAFGADTGRAYVFERAGTDWLAQDTLEASNAELGDEFGSSVAILGSVIIAVGASGEDSDGSSEANNGTRDSGAVYVFSQNVGGAWLQEDYVKASNADTDDLFGSVLAFSESAGGFSLFVSAIGESGNGVGGEQDNSSTSAGAAYEFTRAQSGEWNQVAYIKASNAETGDLFGSAIDVDGDTLAIGAPREDAGRTAGEADNSLLDAGAVYVFTRNGGAWDQQAYLKASNADATDQFGASLNLSGETLAVGASAEDGNGTGGPLDNSIPGAGAVYLIERNGAVWSERAYVKASTIDAGDRFGTSVAVSGELLLIGSAEEASGSTDPSDNTAPGAGAVNVFR